MSNIPNRPLYRSPYEQDKVRKSLVYGLVKRAAAESGFTKPKNKRDLLTDQVKQNIASELEELDMIHRMTTFLVEAGHPAAADWMFEVINGDFAVGPGTWKKQVHLFATRWINYLARLEHATGVDTKTARVCLAAEADVFKWLGNIERFLVPVIMDNHLFMSQEQVIERVQASMNQTAANDGTKVYDITSEGAVETTLTPTDLSVVSGQAPG